jgi:plastocyanin
MSVLPLIARPFVRRIVFVILLLPVLLAPAHAAVHDVTLGQITFDPRNLTIAVNDTVVWTWATSVHNVEAGPDCTAVPSSDPAFFPRSGDPVTAPHTYNLTFNATGFYPYHCLVHCSVGMVGFLTVLPFNSGSNDTGQQVPPTSVSTHDNMRRAHGILMVIAWTLLIPLGIAVARFGKNMGNGWLWFHAANQLLGVTLTLVAFVLITVYTRKVDLPQFQTQGGHRIIGLIVFILSIIQPVLGGLNVYMYNPKRTGIPIFPDQIHRFNGAITALLALANCWLGLSLFCVKLWVVICFGIAALLAIIFLFFLDMARHFLPWGAALRMGTIGVRVPFWAIGLMLLVLLSVLGLVIATAVGIGTTGGDIPDAAFYVGCITAILGTTPHTGWVGPFVAGVGLGVVLLLTSVVLAVVLKT